MPENVFFPILITLPLKTSFEVLEKKADKGKLKYTYVAIHISLIWHPYAILSLRMGHSFRFPPSIVLFTIFVFAIMPKMPYLSRWYLRKET